MANEIGISTASQSLSGASSGAIAGLGVESALVAAGLATGPVGWAGLAIGAGVGLLTGSGLGFLSGSKARKANKYAKKAAAIQLERERNATDATLLQQIRQGRMTREASAAAIATSGIETSSLATSALSSVGSQTGYNLQYLANDRRLYELYANYMRKASKATQSYQQLVALSGSISSVLQSVGTLGLAYAKNKSKSTGAKTEFEDSPESQELAGE